MRHFFRLLDQNFIKKTIVFFWLLSLNIASAGTLFDVISDFEEIQSPTEEELILDPEPAHYFKENVPSAYQPDPFIAIDFSKIKQEKIEDSKQVSKKNEQKTWWQKFLASLNVSISSTAAPVPDRPLWLDFLDNHTMMEKDIAVYLQKYYAHHPWLLWSQNGEITPHAKQILMYFAQAYQEGLNPNDYQLSYVPKKGDPQADFVNFDVELTARLIRYAQDADTGRLVAPRLTRYYAIEKEYRAPEQILQQILTQNDPVKVLKSYHPQTPYYQALRKELLTVLQKNGLQTSIKIIPYTVKLYPKEQSQYWPLIVQYLLQQRAVEYSETERAQLQTAQQKIIYDVNLRPLIQKFQKAVNLPADGIVGRQTILRLQDISPQQKINKLIYTMERLRWLSTKFPERYVLVNQPSYRVDYFEQGQVQQSMKVVIGSITNRTLFFVDQIKTIVFNPYWGVPRSITLREIMPHAIRDPSYLERNNYEVFVGNQQVSGSHINWARAVVRQRPGFRNALGRLKILFPNSHAIYMHDTPNKRVFMRENRAISHGCVRLEKPEMMAAALLQTSPQALERHFAGGKTRSINLSTSVPIYLIYMTAWPDPQTKEINYYEDIYRQDSMVAGGLLRVHAARLQSHKKSLIQSTRLKQKSNAII